MLGAAFLGWFASGAMGPGTLQTSGVEWHVFAVMTGAITAGGLFLAELAEAGMRFIGIGLVAATPSKPRPNVNGDA
jgi:hypothetical protein